MTSSPATIYLSIAGCNLCLISHKIPLNNTLEAYKMFVFDQIDYGKELEKIKHLTFEEKD